MLQKRHILLILVTLALAALTAGCYTVVDTTGRRPASTGRERATVSRDTPDQEQAASDADHVNAGDEQYAEAEADTIYIDDDTGEESYSPGLSAQKYAQKTTEYDEDGKTVINNYYYSCDEAGWCGTWYYSRYGYRPWYRSWYYRPYDPYFSISFGFGSPYWWDYDPWYWDVCWSWTWYDSWHWHEPWYWYPAYAYNPWYSWHGHAGYYDNYDRWHHGGGGNGYDRGTVDSPRKIRTDRLAGFGSSRGSGGIESTGSGSGTEKTVSDRSSNGPTVRRDSRAGFGTQTTRRRDSVEVSSDSVEKPATETSGRAKTVIIRRRPVQQTVTRRGGNTENRKESGDETSSDRKPNPGPVNTNNKSPHTVIIRKSTENTDNSRSTERSDTTDNYTVRRGQSDDTQNQSVSRPASPSSSSGRNGGYSQPSGGSSGQSGSYSQPSSGRSSGGNSRPSTSRSGSRRR